MLRFAFVVAVVVGCSGVAGGEIINARAVTSQERVDELLAIEAGPNDIIEFSFFGAMWTLEGDWEDGTLEAVGHFIPSVAKSYEIAPEVVRVPFARTNSWSFLLAMPLGTPRGMHWTSWPTCCEEPEAWAIGVDSLNVVRNEFGNHILYPGDIHVADVNFDERVDIDDMNIVRNQFGAPLRHRFMLPAAATVPEPSALSMLIPGLFALSALRGRFRCRR